MSEPGPFGPIRASGAPARRAGARRLRGGRPRRTLPALRAKLRRLARDLRFEDAARARDRLAALEEVVDRIATLERLRGATLCVLAPAREPAFRRAFFVAAGRVAAARTLAPARPGGSRSRRASRRRRRAEPSYAPEDADDLLVVAGFLRRPARAPRRRARRCGDPRGLTQSGSRPPAAV